MEAGFFVLVFVGVVMGPGRVSLWGWFEEPGRVSLWGWFEEPGPILSEVFSKPMGQVKLVWWEYPIFGHVFSKLMG